MSSSASAEATLRLPTPTVAVPWHCARVREVRSPRKQYPARGFGMTKIDRSRVEGVSYLRRVMLQAPRAAAFMAVGDLRVISGPEAVSALIDGLRVSDHDVAGRAAWALGELGASEAIPALMGELNDRGVAMPGGQRTSFELAVVKLIKHVQAMGDEHAVSVLLALLEVSNLRVSRHAARSLAELQARDAIPVLIRILEVRGRDLPVGAQLTYIRALREMPHASAVGVLSDALYRKGVQEKAAYGLAELRTPEATEALETAAEKLGWWSGRSVRRAIRLKKAQGLE
jgi:HEAT repeat protein